MGVAHLSSYVCRRRLGVGISHCCRMRFIYFLLINAVNRHPQLQENNWESAFQNFKNYPFRIWWLWLSGSASAHTFALRRLPMTGMRLFRVPVFTASAHRPTVVLNTARDVLDTNQTHQCVVLHSLTQVMTCCCAVKTHVD